MHQPILIVFNSAELPTPSQQSHATAQASSSRAQRQAQHLGSKCHRLLSHLFPQRPPLVLALALL
jgi:hypothetical protein